MREPNLELDGWALRNGVEAHMAAPQTFWIPDEATRRNLKPGDFAKLIFEIRVDNEQEPLAVERMWVVVREVVGDRYVGLLDNEPDSIAENPEFWVGTEVPFGPDHVINVQAGDPQSVALAASAPLRSWPRA